MKTLLTGIRICLTILAVVVINFGAIISSTFISNNLDDKKSVLKFILILFISNLIGVGLLFLIMVL